MYDSITVKKELCMHDLDDFLWSGAKDRWEGADEYTKERVWKRVCMWAECCEEVSDTWVNDAIWFDCDDLFYPEEDEETEDDEEDTEDDEEEEEEEEEEEMKNVNTILIGRISGEFKQLPDGSVENTIVHTTLNNGEETVTFITVRFLGKQAELVRTHLSVGDLCCIEGRRGEETTDTGVVKQYIEAGHITFLATGRRNND